MIFCLPRYNIRHDITWYARARCWLLAFHYFISCSRCCHSAITPLFSSWYATTWGQARYHTTLFRLLMRYWSTLMFRDAYYATLFIFRYRRYRYYFWLCAMDMPLLFRRWYRYGACCCFSTLWCLRHDEIAYAIIIIFFIDMFSLWYAPYFRFSSSLLLWYGVAASPLIHVSLDDAADFIFLCHAAYPPVDHAAMITPLYYVADTMSPPRYIFRRADTDMMIWHYTFRWFRFTLLILLRHFTLLRLRLRLDYHDTTMHILIYAAPSRFIFLSFSLFSTFDYFHFFLSMIR